MQGKRSMGGSGHINTQDYRGGVLIGNWYEDLEASRQGDRTAATLMGYGGPFNATTTSRATFTTGHMGSSGQKALGAGETCVPQQLKFSHGDPAAPPVQCYATMNQLALGQHYPGEPKAQQYLWTGNNKHDAYVPRSTMSGEGGLISSKRAGWQSQFVEYDMYTTTSKATAHAAALATSTLRRSK